MALSLESSIRIEMDGYSFNNALAAWLSFKSKNRSDFEGISAQEARELARSLPNSQDWEERKFHYLYLVNIAKFEGNTWARNILVNTDFSKYPENLKIRVFELAQQYFLNKQIQKELSETIRFNIVNEKYL